MRRGRRSIWWLWCAFALLAGSIPIPASATAQAPDLLVISGREYALLANPLESWFARHPEVDRDDVMRVEGGGGCISSGNWRGYTATFEITGGHLFLVDTRVVTCGDDASPSIVPKVFPGRTRVEADWFTGILVVPVGKRVAYVHLGYGSVYSRYRLFRIEAGKVVDTAMMRTKRYQAYRERQFEMFKQTERYRREFAKLMTDSDRTDEEMEGFVFAVDTDYTTEMLVDFRSR